MMETALSVEHWRKGIRLMKCQPFLLRIVPVILGVPLLSLQRLAINSLTHTTESHGSFLSFYYFHGLLHIFVEFQQRCCFAIKATASFQSRTGFDTSGSFESDGRVLANLIEP